MKPLMQTPVVIALTLCPVIASATIDEPKYLRHYRKRVEWQARRFGRKFLVSAKTAARVIALTFDDGPDPRTTPRLLAMLKKHGVRATFFLVGERVLRHPKIVKRILAEGHAIAGHGFNHVFLNRLRTPGEFADAIEKTQAAFETVVGFRPAFFRPPYGLLTNTQIGSLARNGIATIAWSIDSLDWSARWAAPDAICERVARDARAGAVVLLHSNPGNRTTVAAVECLITRLRRDRFTFDTIPRLLGIDARLPARSRTAQAEIRSLIHVPSTIPVTWTESRGRRQHADRERVVWDVLARAFSELPKKDQEALLGASERPRGADPAPSRRRAATRGARPPAAARAR